MASKWCLWEPKVGQKWTKVESKGRYGNSSKKIRQILGIGTILGSILEHFWRQKADKKGPNMGAFSRDHFGTKKRPEGLQKCDFGTQNCPKRGSRKAQGSQNASFGFQKGPFWTKMGPSKPCIFTWCPEKSPPQSTLFTYI